MRQQTRRYTNTLPIIGHSVIIAIRKLVKHGDGLQWYSSVGKLIIIKNGNHYLAIIGETRLALTLETTQVRFGISIHTLIVTNVEPSFILVVKI